MRDLFIALAVLGVVPVLITFAITRGLPALRRDLSGRWPLLRDDFAASDSKWLQAGTYLFSAMIVAAMVSGVFTALGMPPRLIVWVFCWVGGIGLARLAAAPRVAGLVSGIAMGVLGLYLFHRRYSYEVQLWPMAAREDLFSKIVASLVFGFIFGYGLCAFVGGLSRLVYWLWHRVRGSRRP